MKSDPLLSARENRDTTGRSRSGFSLIEIMVVVALLSVIILGLMAMFTQTQRAFRAGMSQTDILESGRMATDLIARELSQTTPSYYPNPNTAAYQAPNLFTQLINAFPQPLTDANVFRTNIMEDIFFLVRQNQTWTGIGYFVRTDPNVPAGVGPVGTLYRFETNASNALFRQNPGGLFAGFDRVRTGAAVNPRVSRIMDGVISFKIRPFDNSGWMLTNNPSWYTNLPFSLPPALASTNIIAINGFPASGENGRYFFYSNAVPASVELEVGILERSAFEHYQSIPVNPAQTNYLAAQAPHVHLFRQRVPIRNVDYSAYR